MENITIEEYYKKYFIPTNGQNAVISDYIGNNMTEVELIKKFPNKSELVYGTIALNWAWSDVINPKLSLRVLSKDCPKTQRDFELIKQRCKNQIKG